MISQNVPDLLTLARQRREERRIHPDSTANPPPAMQPAPDDVQWRPTGLVGLDEIKQSYRDAPLNLRALIRGVHSTDELTLPERADALEAIRHTEADIHASCKICHHMPAIPFVHYCKFHSLRLFEMHA